MQHHGVGTVAFEYRLLCYTRLLRYISAFAKKVKGAAVNSVQLLLVLQRGHSEVLHLDWSRQARTFIVVLPAIFK